MSAHVCGFAQRSFVLVHLAPLALSPRCVPVIPCCGGRDLGKSLASAQQMREHTWKLMLEDFSEDTEWFVSTEDDAWLNVTRL